MLQLLGVGVPVEAAQKQEGHGWGGGVGGSRDRTGGGLEQGDSGGGDEKGLGSNRLLLA